MLGRIKNHIGWSGGYTETSQSVFTDFGFQPSSCRTSSGVRMFASTAIFQAAQRCAGSPRIRPDRSISKRWLLDPPKTLRVNSASTLRIQGERMFCANQRSKVSTLLNVPYCKSPMIGGGTLNSLASSSTVNCLEAGNSGGHTGITSPIDS